MLSAGVVLKQKRASARDILATKNLVVLHALVLATAESQSRNFLGARWGRRDTSHSDENAGVEWDQVVIIDAVRAALVVQAVDDTLPTA